MFSPTTTYQLKSETIAGATLSYSYDSVGNRLTRLSGFPELPYQNFSFDANDRLNTDQYDANGNTLAAPGFGMSQPDQYDFENRLVSRHEPGKNINIVYDGDGNRVRKTVTTATNAITTFYLVDDQNPTGYAQVLEEWTSDNSATPELQACYVYGHTLISESVQIIPHSSQLKTVFYGYDGHNNVRYLTDTLGRITDTYDYDAFGNLLDHTGTTPNNYLFTGEQYDPDLGLYYLRARYHNPNTGRFWNMDSFEGDNEDPASLHKYTYCGNNPVGNYDPSGHSSLAEFSVASAINSGIVFSFWGAINSYIHGGSASDMALSAVGGFALGFLGGGYPAAIWQTAGGIRFIAILSGLGLTQAVNEWKAGKPGLAAFDALQSLCPVLLTSLQLTEVMTARYGGTIRAKPTYGIEEPVPGEVVVRVCNEDGSQIGSISVSKALDADAAIVNYIVVKPEFRGQGIGTKLYNLALAKLRWPSEVRGEPKYGQLERNR